MPTQPYRTLDGTRVPGVTTVISASLGWNRDPLMRWAHRMGREGRDFEEARQREASAGNLAHDLVEQFIRGQEFTSPTGYPADVLKQALQGYGAFVQWFRNSRFEIVATEAWCVSERHRVGGCIDAIIRDPNTGILSIGDWKTSGGTYPEFLIQIAAYRYLFEEVTGIAVTGGYHVVKFGKHSAHFRHEYWPVDDLEPAWGAFLRLRQLYDDKRVLEKLAR